MSFININIIQFIGYKLKSNLKAEASKNYLGFFWWLMEPALMLGVFYLVFGVLLDYGREGFGSYLLVGIAFWLVFSNTINNCGNAIQSGSGILQQVYIPKWVFPIVVVLSHYTKFIFVLVVLFAYLFYSGIKVTESWTAVLYLLPIYLFFIMGTAFFVASIVPIFPDIKFIIQAGIQMLMFASGIFYDYSMIPEKYMEVFLLNPVAAGIFEFRNILLSGVFPTTGTLIYLVSWGVGLMILGLSILHIFDRRYPRFVL